MTYSVLCKGDKVFVYPRLGKPWAGEVWRRSDKEGYVFIQPKEEGHWAREVEVRTAIIKTFKEAWGYN